MQKPSFAKKLLVNEKSGIYLITATDDGKPAWYYIKLNPLKKSIFLKDSIGKKTKLTDYGEILERGWGKAPPKNVKDRYK